jgi:hypothetical protein
MKMTRLTFSDKQALVAVWRLSAGKAWEPQNPQHPFFERAIRAGYLYRLDGRFGYERIKDAYIGWTDAGIDAMESALIVI